MFRPEQASVTSGGAYTFQEVVMVAADAAQDATLRCNITFLMNGTPGGDDFVQIIATTVHQVGCLPEIRNQA